MKKSLIVLCFVVFMFDIQACQNNSRSGAGSSNETKKKAKYYCTMHPLITADKPGTCPKCGMKLAERDSIDKK